MDENKRAEIATAQAWADAGGLEERVWKPFGTHWSPSYWTKWATVTTALRDLDVQTGARVLDLGCGIGWTSLFLAQAGYDVTGADLAPPLLEAARRHAQLWSLDVDFVKADMDEFELGRRFDFALVFDALHHTNRRAEAVRNIARHVEPGGWVLFGEPSWLHYYSPNARRTTRDTGWVERGVGVRGLMRDCKAAGASEFRRYHEGGFAYRRSLPGTLWQLARVAGAYVTAAPQASIWLAARIGARREEA